MGYPFRRQRPVASTARILTISILCLVSSIAIATESDQTLLDHRPISNVRAALLDINDDTFTPTLRALGMGSKNGQSYHSIRRSGKGKGSSRQDNEDDDQYYNSRERGKGKGKGNTTGRGMSGGKAKGKGKGKGMDMMQKPRPRTPAPTCMNTVVPTSAPQDSIVLPTCPDGVTIAPRDADNCAVICPASFNIFVRNCLPRCPVPTARGTTATKKAAARCVHVCTGSPQDQRNCKDECCPATAAPSALETNVPTSAPQNLIIPMCPDGSFTPSIAQAPVTKAPLPRPTKAPIPRPTKAPLLRPTKTPRRTPTKAPVMVVNQPTIIAPASVQTPIKAPTKIPVGVPAAKAPVAPPLKAPINGVPGMGAPQTKAPIIVAPTPSVASPPLGPTLPSPQIRSDCVNGAMVYGDPHLITFDGVRYACQGHGEYVLFRDEATGGKIHGRFEKSGPQVSIVTGVAVKGDANAPLVEISVSRAPALLRLLVDGTEIANPDAGFVNTLVQVTRTGTGFSIFFTSNSLSVTLRYIVPLIYFPHFAVTVQRPCATTNETVLGLLGSPDGVYDNDWMFVSSSSVFAIQTRTPKTSFEYCTRNWCVANAAESIFVQQSAAAFVAQSGCNEAYPGDVDLGRAAPDLRALCGINQACLVDGIELGVEGARNVLNAEAELINISSSRLTISPRSILVNQSTMVTVTVNLTGLEGASSVDRYRLWRVNATSPTSNDPKFLANWDRPVLHDKLEKIAWNDQSVAGDLVFSATMALFSNITGEVFAFRATPVVKGTETETSPFAMTDLNAVHTVSVESGLVPALPSLASRPVWRVGSTENLALLLEVVPVRNQDRNVVTNVCFNTSRSSDRCGFGYLTQYQPDALSYSYRYKIGQSLSDNPRSSATVTMEQFWSFSSQPIVTTMASLRVSTGRENTDGTTTSDGNAVLLSYPVRTSKADATVIVATIVRAGDGSATIELSSPNA